MSATSHPRREPPPSDLRLILRDLSAPLVEAWRRAFAGSARVEIVRGDIFSDRAGALPAGAAVDVRADALVSPANSFGFMDGGIDAVYSYQLGPQLEANLRAHLAAEHGGELPVGQAVIVPTERPEIPWLVAAPTMRVPMPVDRTANAYLALRAALRAVLAHNAAGRPAIRSVLCPGLATAVGRMPPARCARQMRLAWDRTIGGPPFLPTTWREIHDDLAAMLIDEP